MEILINVFFVLLLICFTLIFFILKKLIAKTKELENLKNYNNTLSTLYDNVRGFKHDFDNIINIIGGYIKANDINGLSKYYNSLSKDCSNIKNVQILNPNIINNPGIYHLICLKYQKAIDLNINVHFEVFFDFNNLKMPIYEFSRILGILLDNAIEAAKECNDKQIYILFRESVKRNVQLITIENSYLDKHIDKQKIFEKGISSKGNHSGIGLWEVKHIIQKFNNVVLHTTNNADLFKQELQIYF